MLPDLFASELFTVPRLQADTYLLTGSLISEYYLRAFSPIIGSHPVNTVCIWGCGAREEHDRPLRLLDKMICTAVRGPRTRRLLNLPSNFPIGDPGLLAPVFHKPSSAEDTHDKTICIPHTHDPKSDDELLSLSGTDLIIRPEVEASCSGLRRMLDRIASARFVLAGSLHAAIIACAYDRPFAFWDSGHVDIPFKWADFAESINVPIRFANNYKEGLEIYEKELRPRIAKPSLTHLLDAAPFEIRPDKYITALEHDGMIDGEEAQRLISIWKRSASTNESTVRFWQTQNQLYLKNTNQTCTKMKRFAFSAYVALRKAAKSPFKLAARRRTRNKEGKTRNLPSRSRFLSIRPR